MKLQQNRLAVLYAHAFFRVHQLVMDERFMQKLQEAIVFLSERSIFLHCFDMYTLGAPFKLSMMEQALVRMDAPSQCTSLVQLLASHGRLGLFLSVLRALVDRWNEYHRYIRGTISSWPKLDEHEKIKIESFFLRKTGCRLIANCIDDQRLIAGIRIKTALHLWERSIRKTLTSFERLALKEL